MVQNRSNNMTISNTTITLSIPTAKNIDSQIATLQLNVAGLKTKAIAIATSIILLGDTGDAKGNHDYQRAGKLLTALIPHPTLLKEVKAFFLGKIPHGFKAVDLSGKIAIGQRDLSLIVSRDAQLVALKIKTDARKLTSEKTALRRESNNLKLAEHPNLVDQIEKLKNSKNEVSKTTLDKTNNQNALLKEQAKESKKAENLALGSAQRVQTANDLLTSDNKKVVSEVEKLRVDLITLQTAYKKLVLENQILQGQLIELRNPKAQKIVKPLRQGKIATKHF